MAPYVYTALTISDTNRTKEKRGRRVPDTDHNEILAVSPCCSENGRRQVEDKQGGDGWISLFEHSTLSEHPKALAAPSKRSNCLLPPSLLYPSIFNRYKSAGGC